MTPEQIRERNDKNLLIAELQTAGARFKGHTCCCPFHEDSRPSAGIFQSEDGSWHFRCHACKITLDLFDLRAKARGTSLKEVLTGATVARNSETKPSVFADLDAIRKAMPGRITSEHPYVGADGEIVMIVCRCETPDGKTYRPVRPVGTSWVFGAPPKPWPVYRLPEIAGADTVVLVEGERCADCLIDLGIAATTSAFGAGKASYTDLSPLAGKNLVIWPDADQPGLDHARDVRTRLEELDPATRVTMLDPAALDMVRGEDVVDFVEQLRILGKADAEIAVELYKTIGAARPAGPLTDYRDRLGAIVRGEIRCLPWPTAWPLLTSATRALQPGRVTMIGGKKGSAKSFLVLQAMLSWLADGISAAVTILEGTINEYMDRALAQLAGNAEVTDLEWVRQHPDETQAAVDTWADELARLAAHVTRSPTNVTLEQLADWAQQQAERGRRIICIDPITAAVRTNKPWISDQAFLNRVRTIAESFGVSILLVTHLSKGSSEFTTDALAGSACYERFSDTIIQLHRHDAKASSIKFATGTAQASYNVTAFIEKARAPGAGLKIAYELDGGSLTLRELGAIVKPKKE